jgi:hypothetical protein
MKLRTALTLAALASLMSLPFGANAQGRGKQDTRQTHTNNTNKDRGRTKTDSKDVGRNGQQNGRNNNSNNNRNSGGNRDNDKGDHGNKSDGRNQAKNKWNGNDDDYRTKTNRFPPVTYRDNDRDRDSHRFYRSDHQDWRDIAFVGGFFAQLTFLNNDHRIYFDGSVGDLYPIWQYDQDRDSDDPNCRARAEFFDHDTFYRDGHRFSRRTVSQNGQRYYEFVRD